MTHDFTFKRVMIKLTGESFNQANEKGLNFDVVDAVSRGLLEMRERTGYEMAIVVGGGNLYRGREANTQVDKATADYIGMLATIMNGLALEESINRLDKKRTAILMTAIQMNAVAETFYRKTALARLEKNRIVILAGGTSSPFFTTDSAAALRAAELNCNIILKCSTTDGVYTSDPDQNSEAQKYKYLNYQTALEKHLKVMDSNAFAICQNEKIPILVFKAEDLGRVLGGEKLGTMVADVPDEMF
ncbi:UMP kinase [Candidatus Beckwithbacteria bacterium]|nr:UMP kinase [Candidatus Beckwithbacteria bacterium]